MEIKNNETTMGSKNVCVIGAGLSGLCTIKELKEAGHHVTCFEASSSIGGSFSLDPESNKVYDSLLLTVSNYFMAYSGYGIDLNEQRRYWNAQEYYSYLKSYANAFNLFDNIQLNTSVDKIEKNGNDYIISIRECNGDSSISSFNAVVICTGTNRIPYTPEVNGFGDFRGEILHSTDYSCSDNFINKKVVCIGMGESSADIIHDIANVADECTVLIRSKPSIVPRVINKETNDAYTSFAFDSLGRSGMNIFMRLKAKWLLWTKENLSESQKLLYKWQLDSPGFVDRFLTKNDVFMSDIAKGYLKVNNTTIKRITKTSVELSDGTNIEADVIIFNTGYRQDFSIVNSIFKPDNFRDLYKHMIVPDIGESLSFIGWARPSQGGVPSVSEMQARYLALLLNGKKHLPKRPELLRAIKQDKAMEECFFRGSQYLSSLVDYHQFMKSMSSLIGCIPKVNPILSPKISYKMWFGCHLSVFYRLNGPGSMRKEAIKTISKLPVGSSLIRNILITLLSIYSNMFHRNAIKYSKDVK